MNYRHQFHAGNFADVMKHALLVALVRALQRKEKGFLALDTHAGRGRYDLEAAATGDSLARRPEWPEGIGRLWGHADAGLPAALATYLGLVRDYDREGGNLAAGPRFYPGSPVLLHLLARPAERIVLLEKHPAECAALRHELGGLPRVAVQEADGYVALRGLLPPPERRALVLIDPPFEAPDEFARIAAALGEGLRRFPSGVFAVWYPLTLRARVDDFFLSVRALEPPPTLAAELAIAGADSTLKLRGCGVLVINPPWRFADEAQEILDYLAGPLGREPGASGWLDWVVPERAG